MAGTTKTSETKLAGLQIQTSLFGEPIVIGWGRSRIGCNMIDYVGFKAIAKTTKQGGKGGGVESTTYSYTASVIFALCEGPITSIRSIYRDSSTFTDGGTTALAQAGLSLATGGIAQAPWGYMTSMFPTHALGYSSLAYVYAQDYPLGSNASIPNHGFEVNFAIQMAGLPDADPKDIVTDYLTNVSYGVTGWGAGLIGNLADWSLYCRASNLLLSPVLDATVGGTEFLTRIAEETNSEFFWSEGVLKCRPYGDATVTANSVTWVPNLTPIYDLTEDDFLEEIELEIVDQSDAYNSVTIEYLDRANQYEPAPMPAQDLDDIITYGLRKQDSKSMHDICDATIAQQVAQLWLQRTLYIRERYRFMLPEDFIGLEPMDYVTLSTASDSMVLNRQLVLIESIDEDESGNLSFIATGVPGQTASAAQYAAHTSEGYQPSVDVDPGNVSSPYIFNAPTSLATQDNEIWCAVSGGVNWAGAYVWLSVDNVTYSQVGVITNPARYGVLTAALPLTADPDTTNTLKVNLTASRGALGTATHAEADAGASMCLVGTELLAYADETLTSAYNYDLTYLRRGQRGTAPVLSAIGTQFTRLDDAIFKFAYDPANVGATIYVKFQSYNLYGRGVQDLAGVTAYTVALSPAFTKPNMPTGLAQAAGGTTWSGNTINLVCNASPGATSYQFDFYKADGTTLVKSLTANVPQISYTSIQAAIDGVQREYKIKVKAVNSAGSSAFTSLFAITNAAPAAVSSAATSGGTYNGTATCTASGDADLGGYIVFFSGTTGFDPATAGSIAVAGGPSITITGLAAATYYAKIAAFDPWTSNPSFLNLSSEVSFTISTGNGPSPTGGGGAGGGFGGYCVSDDTLIMLADGSHIPASALLVGDHLLTQHEHTLEWGIWPVVAVEFERAPVLSCPIWLEDGLTVIRATANHRFWIDGTWVRAEEIGKPAGTARVAKITVDEAHTYVSGGVLSHNIKIGD